jgi:hypothetical protein
MKGVGIDNIITLFNCNMIDNHQIGNQSNMAADGIS